MKVREIESDRLPPGFDKETRARVKAFVEAAMPIIAKHQTALLAELEQLWGDRVHTQIFSVVVDSKIDHPVGTVSTNSFGNGFAPLMYLHTELSRLLQERQQQEMMEAMLSRPAKVQ